MTTWGMVMMVWWVVTGLLAAVSGGLAFYNVAEGNAVNAGIHGGLAILSFMLSAFCLGFAIAATRGRA